MTTNHTPTLTRDLIFKCAQEAGQRSMRANNRTAWDEDDWNVACSEFDRLWRDNRRTMLVEGQA